MNNRHKSSKILNQNCNTSANNSLNIFIFHNKCITNIVPMMDANSWIKSGVVFNDLMNKNNSYMPQQRSDSSLFENQNYSMINKYLTSKSLSSFSPLFSSQEYNNASAHVSSMMPLWMFLPHYYAANSNRTLSPDSNDGECK